MRVRNTQWLPRTFISHDQRSADLLLYPSTPHSEWYVTKRDRRYVSQFLFLSEYIHAAQRRNDGKAVCEERLQLRAYMMRMQEYTTINTQYVHAVNARTQKRCSIIYRAHMCYTHRCRRTTVLDMHAAQMDCALYAHRSSTSHASRCRPHRHLLVIDEFPHQVPHVYASLTLICDLYSQHKTNHRGQSFHFFDFDL